MTLDVNYFPSDPKSIRINVVTGVGEYVVFNKATGDIIKKFDDLGDALAFLFE